MEETSAPPLVASTIPVVLPGQAVGWAAVDKAVRDFDEQMVKDYKEDIDTLLTFAGLFSAALTALLALSYSMLQEDTAGATLQVLRQIARQNAAYTFHNGVLNATVPSPPLSPPFTPSVAAVRINALWFASLVCSLATASIGILVKQWFRAFMACTVTTSAQGRMRLRHFRHPGLSMWKVFEIAATLPLLIQLSLGLFFAGLCYFTLDAHPTVGKTTTTLISAWALFAFVVTMCPVFSARCPYKTDVIEPMLRCARAILHATLYWSGDRLYWISPRGSWVESVGRAVGQWAEKGILYDEPAVVKDEGKDIEILQAADKLQSNDELLGTAMRDALKQSQPGLKQVVVFLLNALSNRGVSCNGGFSDQPAIMNCKSMTRQARLAVVDIVMQFFEDDLRGRMWNDSEPDSELRAENDKAIQWATCILLSPSQYSLPPAAARSLQEYLAYSAGYTWNSIAARQVEQPPNEGSKESLSMLLESISQVCLSVPTPLPNTLMYLTNVLDIYFTKFSLPTSLSPSYVSLSSPDRQDDPALWFRVFNSHSMNHSVVVLTELLMRELLPIRSVAEMDECGSSIEWNKSHSHALTLLLRILAMLHNSWSHPSESAVKKLVDSALQMRLEQPLTCLLLSLIHQPTHAFIYLVVAMTDFRRFGRELKDLKLYGSVVKMLIYDNAVDWGVEQPVRLCYINHILLWFSAFGDRSNEARELWRAIFMRLAQVLDDMASTTPTMYAYDKDIVNACLYTVNLMDKAGLSEEAQTEAEDVAYDHWLRNFEPEENPIPDEYILALMRTCELEAHGKYWRVRRLKDLNRPRDALQDEEHAATVALELDKAIVDMMSSVELSIAIDSSQLPTSSARRAE